MSRIMLDRLIGLETEYATIVRLPADQKEAPSRRVVYDAICDEIAKRLPTARGLYDADAIFLANGGAFSMETSPTRTGMPGGLIEGATAEARSPAALVQCQRAQDRLIAEAARTCDIPGQVTVVKNSCDAHGHIYGCQENYSAPVGEGAMLVVYWIAVALVMIPAFMYWSACIGLLAIEMSVLLVLRMPQRLYAKFSSGDDQQQEIQELGWMEPLPPWLLSITATILRLISMPAAAGLYLVARFIAFRKQRRHLTSFLVSRVVLTGAGHVDRGNRFRLSSKAMAIDTVTGFGGYVGERPIYVFHHWLQQLCGRLLSSRSMSELFYRRQRLQIGLSDSNVSDTAEYLKVGTTSLVLDMIEAGYGRDLPRLRRPIDALHRIASDWHLISRVATTRGDMSGLEIQKAYFRECKKFVDQNASDAGEECRSVLKRWEEALDSLAAFRSKEVDPRPALGHIDWLTKKWMLDQLDEHLASSTATRDPVEEGTAVAAIGFKPTVQWASRKKVDMRYHELSDEGYFAKLRDVAPEVCCVNQDGIELALRLPPLGSPALRRGHLIREFSDGVLHVEADWSHVVIGTGKDRRVVSTG
jgi:Pup amidohydrolase